MLINSATEAPPLAGPDGSWRLFTEDDPAFIKVVGSHLDMDAIAHHRPDAEFPHLAGGVGDDLVIVFQHDAEAPVRKDFRDLAFEGHQILFDHYAIKPAGD